MYLVTVLLWIVAGLLAYQVMADDIGTTPVGVSREFTVTGWIGHSTPVQLRDEVAELAGRQHVVIAQVLPSMTDSVDRRGRREIYATLGADNRGILRRGVDFGPGMRSRIHGMSQLGMQTPIGRWVLFDANPSAVRGFETVLSRNGAQYFTSPAPQHPRIIAVTPIISQVLWTTTLIAVGAAGAFAVSLCQRMAIGRLHGRHAAGTAMHAAGSILLSWSVAGLLACAAEAALCRYVFGSAATGGFLIQSLAFAAVFAGAETLAFIIVTSVAGRTPILMALKGDLPGNSLTIAAYGLRIAAVLLALSLGASTASTGLEVAQRHRAQEALGRLGGASVLTLGNAYSNKEQDEMGKVISDWLRALDERGDVYVAYQDQVPVSGQPVRMLVVNTQFARHEKLLPGSQSAAGGQGIQMIVPEHSWSARTALEKSVRRTLESRVRDISSATMTPSEEPSGTTVFTMSAPPGSGDSSNPAQTYLTDALIVVLPAGAFNSYTEASTNAQVILRNPAEAIKDVRADPRLNRFVRSITPVRVRAAALTSDAVRRYDDLLLADATACIVVMLAGYAAVMTYTRRHAQLIFARHIGGWSVRQTYRSMLIVEALLLAAIAISAPLRLREQRRTLIDMTAGQVPGDSMPAFTLGDLLPLVILAVVTAGGFVMTLMPIHSRIVSTSAREA